MKFRLAPPPAADRQIIRKRNFRRRGGGFQAAVFLPSSLWLEKRRPGGHRHGFWTIVWRILYPIFYQWFTSFLHPNLRMNFQVSAATGCKPPDHSKKKLRPAWRWLPSRRIPPVEPLARKTAARRPPPRFSENCLDSSLSNYKSLGYAVSLSKTAKEVSGQKAVSSETASSELAGGDWESWLISFPSNWANRASTSRSFSGERVLIQPSPKKMIPATSNSPPV